MGNEIKSYRDLEIWRKGMAIVRAVYEITNQFPAEERYGLISQLKRASVSMPSNIAEGYRRNSPKELSRFLYIALGSCAELETQISLSCDLGFLKKEEESSLLETTDHFCRMTMNFIKNIRASRITRNA